MTDSAPSLSPHSLRWGSTEISGPRHAHREQLLLRLLEKGLAPGNLILDAGCGSGSLLIALAKKGYRLRGVEFSEGFVAMVQKKIDEAQLGNVAAVSPGTLTRLEFPAECFDAVVCGEVLEHLQDDRQAVQEFHRVLKRGGICAVSVPAHPLLWDETDEWAGHVRRYRKRELVDLFERNGFRAEKAMFWGFPSVLLYHKLIFLPWMKRAARKGAGAQAEKDFRQAAASGRLESAARLLFSMDGLFRFVPLGIGLMLRAQKR